MSTNLNENTNSQPGMGDLLSYASTTADVYKDINTGDVIKGTVLSISKNEVLIDLPMIGLGVVRGMELYNDEYLSSIKPGAEIDALVIELENEKGMVELSFRAIGRDQIWNELQELFDNKTTTEAKVVHANRGGLMIKVRGVVGFLPASLLSPSHSIKQTSLSESNTLLKQMQKYIGQSFPVKIDDLDREGDKLIVSEKAVSDEMVGQKLSKYKVGDQIEGRVSGIVDFGVFLRFDTDLEGLIHISELAWKKIEDPRESFTLGQLVKAKIISIDGDGRINLSIKQTQENPWVSFAQTTTVGTVIKARVTKITTYGAICVTENQIQGLCYIGQMSETPIDNPAKIHDIVKVGQEYDFTIIEIHPSDYRLSLSLLPYDVALKVDSEIKAKRDSPKMNEIPEIAKSADTTETEESKPAKKSTKKAKETEVEA
jgi:ribosomal protein S1